MRTGEGAALLLEVRRSSGQLFYFDTEHGFRVPTRKIQAIPAEAVTPGSLERLLSDLLLFLEAEGCALDEYSGQRARLAVQIPALTGERIHSLLDRFGAWVTSFAIEPGSMHTLLLKLRLDDLPACDRVGPEFPL